MVEILFEYEIRNNLTNEKYNENNWCWCFGKSFEDCYRKLCDGICRPLLIDYTIIVKKYNICEKIRRLI